MTIQTNVSLLDFNTFHIEAKASHFVEISTEEEFIQLVHSGQTKLHQPLILGGGSNMLFTKDFDGLAIKNNLKGIQIIKEDDEHVFIKASAGEVWHEFVLHCIAKNYGGLENLSLIPGSVGAGPIQNIGAYGVELKDTFFECEAIHMQDGSKRVFSSEQCKFGYRESVFKHELKGQYFICSVTFKLSKKPTFKTDYGQIQIELDKMGVKELSVKAISDAVCNIRRSKLPNPAEIGNAGSFFKNPVVSKSHFEKIKEKYPDVSSYPNGENVKLAAGWLIEKAGWKGKTFGEYGVHKNQALVLVNYGKAKGAEIYQLSQEIIQSIDQTFGIQLEREVNMI
ncbi:MAG: UDP-N-acetylmuramate dehydrogenase [Flavobacteriales bacterium]